MVASKNQFTTSNIYAYSEPLDDVVEVASDAKEDVILWISFGAFRKSSYRFLKI